MFSFIELSWLALSCQFRLKIFLSVFFEFDGLFVFFVKVYNSLYVNILADERASRTEINFTNV